MHEKCALITLTVFFNCITSQSNHTTVNHKPVKKELKMVNSNCDIEMYSYLVAITNLKTFVRACEGTLIADIWVLTSGKCGLLMTNPYEYVIMIGQSRINRANLQMSGIRRVISHSEFNGLTSANDIALLELVTPMPETGFVTHVRLPFSGENYNHTEKICSVATIIGWNFNKPKCVNATVITINKCIKLYQYQFTDQTICTLVKAKRERAACWANTGGPLVCGHYQYGVTSRQCLLRNMLTISTNLQYYKSFIEAITRSNSCNTLYLQKNYCYLQLLIYLMYVIILMT